MAAAKKTANTQRTRSTRKRRRSTRAPWRRRLALTLALIAAGGLIYLDALVRSTLTERQWQQPAKVFARPLTLTVGQSLRAGDFEQELRALGYRFRSLIAEPGDVQAGSDGVYWLYLRRFVFADGVQPAQRVRLRLRGGRVVELSDHAGQPVPRLRVDPLPIGGIQTQHREDRRLVQLEAMPKLLPATVLLVEDRYFYEHWGLSLRGIARAMVANLRAGRVVQGGSTITQQLVKNVFLSHSRSLWRKLLEVPMALLTELHFSKSEILELYLNEVYLGQEGPRAIHGLGLASRHYFNRPVNELSDAQIAMLVGMIKGPAAYAPWRRPEAARQRRDLVLRLMAEHDLLRETAYRRALAEPLGMTKRTAVEGSYPAYLDLVRRQLRRDYAAEDLATNGLRIFTAFHPLVQRRAEESVRQRLAELGEEHGELEAAMVVTGVDSGDVLAVVGGRRTKYAGFNRALDAVRPIGSLIKPAVYLSALQHSQRYTLISKISDGPVTVKGDNGQLWQPKNFDRESHGQVALHRALSQSYNQATARLGMEVGLGQVINTRRELGVQRDIPYLPSVLLGALELSPIEVAAMYQTIAAQGVHSRLRSIRAITDSDGRLLARYPGQQRRVIAPEFVHMLHYALQEVVREGTGKGVYRALPEDFSVAGKTGTTDEFRDSWFAGFAGDYLAVVWLGRDDNRSTQLTGASGALPVWRRFMAASSSRPMHFETPAGVTYAWISDSDGLRASEHCRGARYMPFLEGTAPSERSDCVGSVGNIGRWFKNLFGG